MGGSEKTQSFARLFLLPGSEHGPGGPGADIVDYLRYIEDWVAQGKAPDKLIAAHLKSIDASQELKFPLEPTSVAFTRPLYPHPVTAKYRGSGDPNDAANFEPIAR
jgi:Tannase and feruloyl esterase